MPRLLRGSGGVGRKLQFSSTRIRVALVALVVLVFLFTRHSSSVGTTPTSWHWPSSIGEASAGHSYHLPPQHRIEDHETLDLSLHPASPLRPANQFWHAPTIALEPVFAIGTVVTDPTRELVDKTYASLAQGSLISWRWHILDVGSRDQASIQILKVLEKDPRVTVHRAKIGPTEAESLGLVLSAMKESGALYGMFLFPYAMVEHTILEKSAWTFSSVPTWDILGHFEAKSDVSHTGVHSGPANLEANSVPDAAAFRLDVFSALNCTFDNGQAPELLMWEFWLCLAARGHWGGTIPEIGSWPAANRRTNTQWAKSGLEQRYPRLSAATFPSVRVKKHVALEPISWEPPFENMLPRQTGKSIMIIQGWLLVGGSELGMLEVLRHFAERGYRVTMVLTRLKYPTGLALQSLVAQYTNDIHTLPAFLRMSDFPRYIKYLIDSRGIDTALMSNSQLIYELLPSLAEQSPQVSWIDYLHNEAFDGWKTDGFPTFALISQRYLTRTLTCSYYLREWLIARGYPADRVGVAKLGINITRFDATEDATRHLIKTSILGVEGKPMVLASSARLDTQKRPLLVPDIVAEVNARLAELKAAGTQCESESAIMYMMGDGDLRDALKDRIKAKGMTKHVFLLGTVDDPSTVLRGSDAFLLPSATEGISLAVAEAMAMTIPIITSHAGGLPEQLGDMGSGLAKAGRLIKLTGDIPHEVSGYADAVVELACSQAKTRGLGKAAREHVKATFDQDDTLEAFDVQFAIAKKASRYDTARYTVPNPAAYYGLQDMAMEDHAYVDLSATQKQLTRAKLTGRAGQLQSRCWLEGASGERWSKAVLDGVLCGQTPTKQVGDWLFKAAREQCGAWCLWDLRSTQAVGWHFNGKCFSYFQPKDLEAQSCMDWFEFRPPLTFLDTAMPKLP